MKIVNSFSVALPAHDAWLMLTSLPTIAQCVPGTSLSSKHHGIYYGAVHLKAGPVAAVYRGTARIVEQHDAEQRVVVQAVGSDTRGREDAQALITATLTDYGAQTQIDLTTDLTVVGRIAPLGKGMAQDASEKLVTAFHAALIAEAQKASSASTVVDRNEALVMSHEDASAPAGSAADTTTAPPSAPVADDRIDVDEAAAVSAGMAADQVGEPLDLVHVAGAAVARRVWPVAATVAAVVVALLILL